MIAYYVCMCELKITSRPVQLARSVTLSTLILSGMRNYFDVNGVTRSQKMQHLPQFCSQEYVIISDVCMPSSDLLQHEFPFYQSAPVIFPTALLIRSRGVSIYNIEYRAIDFSLPTQRPCFFLNENRQWTTSGSKGTESFYSGGHPRTGKNDPF